MRRFIPTILLLILLVITIMIGKKTQDIRENTNMSDNKMFGENPIIKSIYTADPAPMVYGDTLYLYTTHDEDVLVNDFYWLHISNLELGKGKTVVVSREGNSIHIERSDCRELTFLLNDEMMNLDRPVSVYYQGRLLCKKRVRRTMAHLRETLYSRNDPAYAFPASLTVVMPTQHQ